MASLSMAPLSMASLYKRQLRTLSFLAAVSLLLGACATQPADPTNQVPGFLLGIFHGFTIMFSLIGSLFTDYRIYAYPNSGFWYDLGYLFGVMMLLGGGGAGATHHRSKGNENP